MVDIRPMLFAQALLLMLIVLAGFGSIQRGTETLSNQKSLATASPANTKQPTAPDQSAREVAAETTTPPSNDAVASAPVAPEPEQTDLQATVTETPAAPQADTSAALTASSAETGATEPAITTETVTTVSQAQTAMETPPSPEVAATAIPEPAQAPQITTGKLIVRSNVSGDMVLINGKVFGPTKMEIDLPAGTYDVEVTKSGFAPWKQQVSVRNGEEAMLHARLEGLAGLAASRPLAALPPVRTVRAPTTTDNGSTAATAESAPENGPGTARAANGDSYTGMFKNGKYNGEGTLTKSNGDVQSGLWVDGQLSGQGTITARDGTLYVGALLNGKYHGEGSLTFPDGRHYQGGFSNGKYHGKGMETFKTGKSYSGQFMDGKYHGQGEIRNPNGSKIASTFRYGKPFGQATLTTPEGEVFTARTNEPGVCYRENSYRATQCPPMEGW